MSAPSYLWKAPAKVNLSLKVLGKRDDGFHELESLMVPIDLEDQLLFEPAEHYRLACDFPGVPVDDSNLVSRAVRLFEEETGRACRWSITLKKSIPHGAGLGGGSSDAATALLALNELEQAGLTLSQLAEIGARIGSDIPFFIYRQVCWVRGRGERVEPTVLDGLTGMKLLLLKPDFGVSTPAAYQRWADARPLAGINYEPQCMAWGQMVNDLEMPVFEKHRFLAELKDWLGRQPDVDAAMMSGSGSTMMAVIAEAAPAEYAATLLERARSELDPTLWGEAVTVGGGISTQ